MAYAQFFNSSEAVSEKHVRNYPAKASWLIIVVFAVVSLCLVRALQAQPRVTLCRAGAVVHGPFAPAYR